MRVSPAEYAEYLKSDQWASLREIILTRANHLCDMPGCLREPIEVHHLTYDRLGEEDWRDLAAVCELCHRVLHDPSAPTEAPCICAHEYEWSVTDPCGCPFCVYRRRINAARLAFRKQLVAALNTFMLARNEAIPGSKPSGLKQEWECREGDDNEEARKLPPSLLCKRTGLAAGTEGSCGQCDSCLWVAAMEADFVEREGDPDA